MTTHHQFEALVVGAGGAGLMAALHCSKTVKSTAVISKLYPTRSHTGTAQGGVAAPLGNMEEDNWEWYMYDTVKGGDYLVDQDAAEVLAKESSEAVIELEHMGLPFDRTPDGKIEQRRFGGHTRNFGEAPVMRSCKAADRTGHMILQTLYQQCVKQNVKFFDEYQVIDLIIEGDACQGVVAIQILTGEVHVFHSKATLLAIGGFGRVWSVTSNAHSLTGDTVATVYRHGLPLEDMEFFQFHPTGIYKLGVLISEAVRGEGGLLKLPDGTRFMPWHDERAELAPRDIVARAIDFEMKKRGLDCVYLDISHQPAAFLQEHFPTIYAYCLALGIDITRQPIPVVPAAHYTCGGVVTDLRGRADVDNLYAIGETSHTGLHGANRLASNSLLECLVFAEAAARDILAKPHAPPIPLPQWDESRVTDADEEIVIAHNWAELRRFMWDYVGIVRTTKRLQRAQHRIKLLHEEINEYYSNFRVTSDLLELRNLVLSADLIVQSALVRHESRGLHYSKDYPDTLPQALPTVLTPPAYTAR